MKSNCETCMYFGYDEEYEEYYCEVNLDEDEMEKFLQGIHANITVAIMGCVVNGPGEAKEADIGIAAGEHCAVIFKKDGTQRKIKEEDIVAELLAEADKL